MVLGRDQAREDRDAAGIEDEVVIAAAELDAAHLHDAQPSALGTELARRLLQRDHAVGDAVELHVAGSEVRSSSSSTVQLRAGEELLQRQDLAAIAQRVLREQTQLRQAVEHDAVRLEVVDAVDDLPHRLAEFDLGGMQDRLLAVRVEAEFADELVDLDARRATSHATRPRRAVRRRSRTG